MSLADQARAAFYDQIYLALGELKRILQNRLISVMIDRGMAGITADALPEMAKATAALAPLVTQTPPLAAGELALKVYTAIYPNTAIPAVDLSKLSETDAATLREYLETTITFASDYTKALQH